MFVHFSLYSKVLCIITFSVFLGLTPSWAQKKALVHTDWRRSDSLQQKDCFFFFSYYSLYIKGKVIIPMFMVTNTRYLYRDFSLYRFSLTTGLLERVWSNDNDDSEIIVDLKACRYAQKDEEIYFCVPGRLDNVHKERFYNLLAYNLENSKVTMFREDMRKPDVETLELIHDHSNKVKESTVWGSVGLVPLKEWSLPSPLEYSSREPEFLKRIIIHQQGDRALRYAALSELDETCNETILNEILIELKNTDGNCEQMKYTSKWMVLIRMSSTLRRTLPVDIFSAAFTNDTERLSKFLDTGADPNTVDDHGCSLLMYSVLGEAPDTMTLLFSKGADPLIKSKSGTYPWLYAALNPLRERFLALWGK